MGLLLLCAFLVSIAFNIATGNTVKPNPYRFPVYPVNECPRSKNEFKTAAQRRNCTRDERYLCAPNKYISSLIEFCTDRPRSLYEKGNCVLLEGTGDLDHYSCVEKFNSSCPSEYYYDEEIYKYPACLEIDKKHRCFVADNDCNNREFPTTETRSNISKMETRLLAIVYIIAVVSSGMILIWVIYRKRKKEQVERYKKEDEHKPLLKDPKPPIEQNDVELDQTAINVSKHNQIHTTSTYMLSETAKTNTQKLKTIQREEEQNEESGYKTAMIDGKQQHNPEIDDDTLRQFLSKGKISVCHVRCIIVGCGKAGKTTLLKRLQNASFDELMQIERTEMVDFHVNSFEVLTEEETIQSVDKEDTLPTILFSKEQLEMPLKENDGKMAKKTHQPGIRKKNVSQKPSLKNTTLGQIENKPMVVLKNQANNDNAENEEKLIFEQHSQDTTLVQNQFSLEPNEEHGENIDANVDKIDFEKFAILKIKDAVNELLKEKDLRPRITFLDFAGQSMYYAFHQIFLRPKSCSLLVVDMTKSLYDKVCDQDENEKECSQFASWRYKDYYKFWLKSIDSYSDTESPVIIVGTHADKLSKEECRKFHESLLKFFDNWSHSDLRRHVNAERMFTIGFPDSGSELGDLKDLKKCIANIVKSPRYSNENTRPVWALFEHILNIMKETKKVIPRKTISEYSDQLSAQEFRIDESEISKMLGFFHRVGILLYFDKDGLKENIILDIQWLLDAFKCIIEYYVKPDVNDIKRTHFYRTGELDNVELDRIWHTEGKDFLKHRKTIIAYMQQLGLLTPLKELHSPDSTVYYFPSMNSKRFDKTGWNYAKSSILCFKFDEKRQLPIYVFHSIVLKCSKQNNWSILTEGAKNNICLYQNAACFSFQKHVVVLCNCNFEIRVQVWASPKIYDGRLLKKIKHSVEDIICDIIHDDDLLSYEIGYKCRKDVLNDEEDVSFISQSIFPVYDHLCEICDVDKKHVVDNDICWELEVIYENQDLSASNFVVSGGTCNTQMEGQKDAETSVYTRIEETDTLQANSDLVSEIRCLPNREKPSVTHTESNRQTVLEAEHTHVLNTRCHNDNIGVLNNETDSGTDTIQNIEENVLPDIPGVDIPMHSDLPASNFVVSGGTCNTQMEGQNDADTSVYTRIEETDTLQANSDLVSEIGFLPNSEKTSVTHTESNRQTVLEAEHTHVLNTRCHNDNMGVLNNETDSGADTIQNIEENALPEIPGVDNPVHSDMVENTDAWTESINSETLSNLFDSFKFVIPEDPFQMSFTRILLDTSKLDEFVSEIRLLSRIIVLCKHIKEEDKILGTVYVYEVAVKHKENQMVIEEMDPREQEDFFHRKNDNLIKVIWIRGGSSDVPETKSKVYEKYKKNLQLQTIHLHHEMEHCAEVAKLIAHKKIQAYISYIMSFKNSIPINHIGDIVSDAVNRALSKESITRLCFETVIEESGNINSDPYICRSSSTVERLKKELVERTLESVSKYLGEDICKEMQRHIVTDIKRKYNIDVNPFTKFLEISGLILLQTVLTVIAGIINPFAGVIVGIVSAVGTFIITVNVNSETWRRDVASEIYENVSKNKENVIRDVTSSIKERCKITIDELDNIAKKLETFRTQIVLSD